MSTTRYFDIIATYETEVAKKPDAGIEEILPAIFDAVPGVTRKLQRPCPFPQRRGGTS